jgi:hypothetical protein
VLLVHWIDAGDFAAGAALVEPLAAAGDTQAMLLGGRPEGVGQGKVSGETCDLLREDRHDFDVGVDSVSAQAD